MSNLTLADIELAKVYFEILVGLAKSNKGQTIEYGELVKLAKEKNPGNAFVDGAIPVSMGRRLDALREFTKLHKLPDLSALVVNKATGTNGKGFLRSFDGDAVREQIAAFDWSSVQPDFEHFIANEKLAFERRQIKKRKPKKIKEPEVRQIWWNFCRTNPTEIGTVTQFDKEATIKLIMQGLEPQAALNQVRSLQP